MNPHVFATKMSRALLSMVVLLCVAAPLWATLPALWPRFSAPTSIVNIGLVGQSGDDFLATTSFQGAYNQQQLSSRLYISTPADASYWLAHGLPSSITVSNLSYSTTDPDGVLKSLLATYGPQGTNTVSKYIICDPVGAPETCNMATTMAGINDAMVVNPDNLTVISSYGLTELADLRTYSPCLSTSTSYCWIGSSSTLVTPANGFNTVTNPSGSGGTTGWSTSGGSVTTGAPSGSCSGPASTLEFTRTSGSGDAWAFFDPSTPLLRVNSYPYIFSVQVCVVSGSAVFLDAYNGAGDVQSSSVASGSGWQTLQLAVPIPLSGAASGNTTVKIQVRTAGSSTNVFFQNAAVIDNRVAIDEYQLKNLIGSTSKLVLAQDFATSSNLRDYLIAGKVFTFGLTSIYTDESALYTSILASGQTPRVTPILGYVDNENADVEFMGEQAQSGHYLNASDDYNNGSVWASLPSPSSLTQPIASPLKINNGTTYIAIAASDGDNASVVEHQDVEHWTGNNFLGAVPMAWTVNPSMLAFSPALISNFYEFLPGSSELMSGPSGVGYERGITNGAATDMSTFATDTNDFMVAESMNSVTNWSDVQADLDTFTSKVGVPHVVWNDNLAWTPGTPVTTNLLDGQGVGYNATAPAQVSAIVNCLAAGSKCSPYQGTGAPTFLEVLNDDFTLPPDDILYIAQQVANQESYPIVFMTPSELAAAEYTAHYGGTTVNSTPQAVLGATLLSAFPQNVLWNSQGQSGNYGITSPGKTWALGTTGHDESLVSTVYEGSSVQELTVPGNSANPTCYAYQNLGGGPTGAGSLITGRYYLFSATVAGANGTAQFTVYDGSANHTATIALTPAFQTISMMVQINSASAGQIEIGVTESTAKQILYFNGGTSQPVGWFYNPPSSTGALVNAGGTTYNNGYFNTQSMYFNVPASQSSSQWVAAHPGDAAGLIASTSYTATVDVAGGTNGGTAYLDLYNGSGDTTSSTATLTQQWQTLTATYTSGSTPSNNQFEVRVPSGNSGAESVFFRNATLVPTSSIPSAGFKSGLESGDPQLNFTNTVDNGTGGGGESNVSGALTEASSTITRGGGYAIQYGGTASGGTTTDAYMEAFTNSTALTSASRLSYWIYPVTPLGSETGASSATAQNSTCVSLDIIFTDGTALRNLSIKDQFSNALTPNGQCSHLQPDQWNYVTANLSGLSGKTVSRIDVGYSQPGASGKYAGFIDDILLSH